MEKFTTHTGLALPLDRENVDTDAIIPKQFLKSIHRTGFGPNLFDAWRYLDAGEPGQDPSSRRPNPEFVLNEPRYRGATILVAGKNFGCGSSREHAPWALQQYGFRAIVAPSYADIFFNNCFKNGLLAIVLPDSQRDFLIREIAAQVGYRLTIDLPAQTLATPSGQVMGFEIEPYRKECLVNGWDEIGRTLLHREAILAFEERRRLAEPWIFS